MSSVRISDDTYDTLRVLADLEGENLQTVLNKAIECYRRSRFWQDVENAAGKLRQDQVGWNEELAERQAWDATLGDGQDDT